MNILDYIRDYISQAELTATGGFAYYVLACVLIVTLGGLFEITKWLYLFLK